jgi:hypothetical protein
MERKHDGVRTALGQVQSFLDEHDATLLKAVNATGARAALDAVITTLSAQAADQEAHRRESVGASAKHIAARKALLEYHMRGVASAARLLAPTVPELAGITAPGRNLSTAAVVSAADGVVKLAEQHEAVLATMLKPDFLAKLRTAVQEVKDAVASGRTSRNKRTGATKAVKAEAERGRAAVKILDALVLEALAGNEKLVREWKSRRKIFTVGSTRNPASAPAGTGVVAEVTGQGSGVPAQPVAA